MTTQEEIKGELIEFPKAVEWNIYPPGFYFMPIDTQTKRSYTFSFADTLWHLRLSPEPFRSDRLPGRPIVNPPTICSVSLVRESGCFSGVITKRFIIITGDRVLTGKAEAVSNSNVSEVLGEEVFKNVAFSLVKSVLCYLKSDPSGKQDLLSQPKVTSETSAIEALHQLKLTETDVLSKNLKDLFTNKDNYDTVLQVKDKEFKVHKSILIARSSVFAAMFRYDTSENQTGVVNIPDCDSESFNDFLEYLYSGKLADISFDGAANLYRTSDKYDVQELKAFCLKYMMQTLTAQNVCDAVILADECDETELMSAIQAFFNENVKNILVTSEWERLMKSNYRLANKLLIEMSKAKH